MSAGGAWPSPIITPRAGPSQVELANGIVGVGISIGGDPACYIIEKHLARFVEGQDVHNVELIWEQCFKVGDGGGLPGRQWRPAVAVTAAPPAPPGASRRRPP